MRNIIFKRLFSCLVSLFLLLAVIPFFISCAPELSFEEIVICEEVDSDTYAPLTPRNQFNVEVKKIYAVIKVSGVKGDDSFLFLWKNKDTGKVEAEQSGMYSPEHKGYFEGYFTGNIYTDNEDSVLLAPGDYTVEFYHNGEFKKNADFSVLKPQVKIVEVILANQIDENLKPVNITDKFNLKDTLYACVRLNYIISGDVLSARWYYGEHDLKDVTEFYVDENLYKSGFVTFSLSNEPEPWPYGKFKVEIYLNKNLHDIYTFEVVGGELFSEGNSYSNDKFEIFFLVPDQWEYGQKEDVNSLKVELISPSPESKIYFSFIVSTPEDYPPKEKFSSISDGFADDIAAERGWTQVDRNESENILENGKHYQEFIYTFDDTDGKKWFFTVSFIEENRRLYIFLGIALSHNYELSTEIYNGILNSIEF